MATAPEIDLSLARDRVSPAQALRAVADACERLNVTSFDVYGDLGAPAASSWMRRFEAEIAAELGKADALFVPSGVMAQQIALLIHSEKRAAARGHPMDEFIAHYSSHLLLHEQAAAEHLLHMRPLIIPADSSALVQQPLTWAALAPLLCPPSPHTGSVMVELPHREVGGKLTPWEDLVSISTAARDAGVALHMDGARLWEAAAGYARSLSEICALFDSVYVSFYKGLGGMTGAALAGDDDFIAAARVWLRRFGGNLYTMLPYAVSDWDGFQVNKDDFSRRKERLQHIVAMLTRECASPLLRFDPPVPCVSLVHVYLDADLASAWKACHAAAAATGVRCFSRLRPGSHAAATQSMFELNCGPANGALGDDVWLRGWKELLAQLRVIKAGAT